jgi:hypothetical protein
MSAISCLDRFLDPLTEVLSPDVARRLVGLRPTAAVQARCDVLASKANDGTLTVAEEAEYKTFRLAADITAIFQAKAARYLARVSDQA